MLEGREPSLLWGRVSGRAQSGVCTPASASSTLVCWGSQPHRPLQPSLAVGMWGGFTEIEDGGRGLRLFKAVWALFDLCVTYTF